jgi:hypothetical protein
MRYKRIKGSADIEIGAEKILRSLPIDEKPLSEFET